MITTWPTDCQHCTATLKNRVVKFASTIDDQGLIKVVVVCPNCEAISYPLDNPTQPEESP